MKHSLFPLIACVLLPCTAYAQTLSFEFGIPVVESTTEIDQSGNLGLFNSNLGTLTGASLELFGAGTTSGTLKLNDNAGSPDSLTATISSILSFNSGLAPLDAIVSLPANDVVLQFNVASSSFNIGQTKPYGPLTDSENITLNLNSILASLQAPGGGTFSVGGTSLSGITVFGGGGNTSSTQDTTAGIGARITYTYTPFAVIPEPSQAISTLALCTFGLMLRRRAAKR